MTHHYLRVFLTALIILIINTIANGQIHYNAHTELTNGLNVPKQMVFDTTGQLYVANHSFASYSGPFYNTIAKIDPAGNKVVFVSGYSWPSSLVIDQQQNIYFTQNNAGSVIRKADPTGTVTSYASLPHQPGPITLYQYGSSLNLYTVSHWGAKSIYLTTATNTSSLFDAGTYWGNQVSLDGQFLYAWLTDTLYRFNTNTQVKQAWVSKIKSIGEFAHAIGPDSCLYLIGRSVCDSTKKAVFRINGYEDVTEIVTQLPMGNEFHGIAFHTNSSNETKMYLSEVVNGNRGNPLDNRIIKFNLTNPALQHSSTLNILGSDTVLCNPVNLLINTAVPYSSILWSTNDTTGAITINQPGTFWVRLKNDYGCQFTDTINLLPCPFSVTYFLHDTLICPGETVTLTAPAFNTGTWIYFEDFENPVGSEWSDTIRFPFNNTIVSGPYGIQQVQLQLSNLPVHDSVEVSFNLYIFDTWDGNEVSTAGPDFWGSDIDGDTLIYTTFCNQTTGIQSYPSNYPDSFPAYTGAVNANLPLRCWPYAQRTTLYNLVYLRAHLDDTISIHFFASNLQSLCDESWSIDNVQVKLLNTPAPAQYLWSTSDTTQSITVSPSQTTTYTVTITSGPNIYYDSCTVYVASIDAGPNDTICMGDSTQLAAAPGAADYSWTPATGLSGTTIANPLASPSATTQYHLAALYQHQNQSKTCYDSVTVTVIPPPQISLGNDIIGCQGGSFTLNPGAGFTSYLWSNSATTATITVTQSGTYWVLVKNSFNCESTDSINVTLHPYPLVTVSPAIDTICLGDTLTILATSNITGSTYTWSNGSLTDSTFVSPSAPAIYTVTVTSQGCSSIDTARIYTKPVPDPFVIATKYMMCDGDTTTIQAITLYPNAVYQWSSGHNTATITVTPSSSTTFHVTATFNGCSGDTSVNIEVNPIPQINLTAAPIQVCLGDSAEFNVTSNVWGTQFTWSTGQTGPKIFVPPTTDTTIHVTGTVNGCFSSDTVSIQIKPVPDISVTISQTPICQGDSVVMTASSNLPGTSFIWSTGAVTAQLIQYPYIGTIYIAMATLNGCTSDTTLIVDVNPRPTLQVTPSPVDICIGEDATIAITADLPGTTFIWANGLTGSPVTFTPTSSIVLSVTGSYNTCDQMAWVNVNVHPLPEISLGEDGYICERETVTLQPTGNYSLLTWWDGTNGMTNNITEPGTYWVIAGMQNCSAIDSVTYVECPTLFVPNAFTPNGDGFNDEFYVVHESIDIKSIYIFNRWGNPVFITTNPSEKWNGTNKGQLCPEGVYFYVVRYFNPMTQLIQEKAGSVHLLR